MNREINIRLNANRAKAVHTGHKFASGDKGIVFRIAVDELDTTGTTAKIVFKRSNGTSVEAGITGTEGVYSYTTLGNEFAVVGPVTADVKFYENENRVSTCTFVYDVTADTLDGLGNGTAGYSDTLERMKKSMEQAEADILAAKDELEKRAEEILQQMKETAESAEEDVETAEQKMVDLSADLEALYQEYVDAFGSTGPFNPRGPYSETETYTVRDMVSHNDASWVCYRNCTGATPSKESDCWQYFAVGAEVNLDDYAPLEALEHFTLTRYVGNTEDEINAIYDSIYANVKDGEWFRARVHHNGSHSILEGGMWYLEGYRGTSIFGWEKITNYTANGVRTFARMLYGTTTWSEWVEDFTTVGGEIKGNVIVRGATFSHNSVNAEAVRSYLGNAMRSLMMIIGADGSCGLFDNTNNKFIVQSTAGGTNTFNGTASGNLPLTGGTVTSSGASPIKVNCTNSGANTVMQEFYKLGTLLGKLGISETKGAVYRTSGDVEYPLLHTGNKPTGTYTGNGDATQRTISTGGIGSCVMVRKSGERGIFAIVTESGYYAKDGSNGEDAYFASGVLTIASTSNAFNTNGATYYYQVL